MSTKSSLALATAGMICLLGIGSTVFGVTALGGAPEKPQSGELPNPILDTHHLMEYFNQPLYQNLRKEMQSNSFDADKFATIEKRGEQAAEIANLVSIRNHDFEEAKWEDFAGSLQQAGIGLKDAASSEDEQAVKDAYRNLVQSCNDCHTSLAAQGAPRLKL